jgi:hypothetical protein
MLSVQVDANKGIAILEPHGALSKEDFERAAKAIDPHLRSAGTAERHRGAHPAVPGLGLVRRTRLAPALREDHHQKIARVALCTDSALGRRGAEDRPSLRQGRDPRRSSSPS